MLAFLLYLFNFCFTIGQLPNSWGKSVITPIHKDSNTDKSDPGNYRGIAITSSLYKLYCCIINCRLSNWVEKNGYLEEEQNGFCKNRSTVDQLLSFTSIIETRRAKRLDTYVAYIDFSKAYDKINRSLLWNKLNCIGLEGNILNAVKSLYNNVSCCVKLGNGNMTDWFPVSTGLRQGCLLSPLLFFMYLRAPASTIFPNRTLLRSIIVD